MFGHFHHRATSIEKERKEEGKEKKREVLWVEKVFVLGCGRRDGAEEIMQHSGVGCFVKSELRATLDY